MRFFNSIEEMVGHTPLLQINNIKNELGFGANIFAKLEYLNPAGSAKDRVAVQMIKDAEEKGILKAGSIIIEPTSGNTGIGLAAVGTSKGYRSIIVMPDSMSVERIKTIEAFGAEVILTPGAEGMSGAIKKAEELAKEYEGSFIAGQFTNPSNPKAHYLTTGPEIYDDLDGQVDVFIAGVGTGGTLSGAAKYLKEKKSDVRVVAVEPSKSPLLSKGYAGSHGLMGIGANFVPKTLDVDIIDEIITVDEEDAYTFGRLLGNKEGILVGITSGAAMYAAVQVAKRPEYAGKNIVTLLPDTGDRYLSTPMFE